MSTAPTITCLALDADGDLLWNSILTDIDAVSQLIKTRLLLFAGEWWETSRKDYRYFNRYLAQVVPSHKRRQFRVSSPNAFYKRRIA